jgi:hypothetical protein
LRFLDFGSGKQEITGSIGRIGDYFRHRRGSGTNETSMSVHPMFPSRAATRLPARIIQSERKMEASRPPKVNAPRVQGTHRASDGWYGWSADIRTRFQRELSRCCANAAIAVRES